MELVIDAQEHPGKTLKELAHDHGFRSAASVQRLLWGSARLN
jgi:hypothetical protein